MGLLGKLFGGKKKAGSVYLDMRALWLTGPLAPLVVHEQVQAVMMEEGAAGARVCVLAAADGSTSMCIERVGGIIGGQGILAAAGAAAALMRRTVEDLDQFAPVDEIPSSSDARVAFCVRTPAGLLAAEVPRSELSPTGTHRLGALYVAAQELASQFPIAQEASPPLDVYVRGDGGLQVANVRNPKPVWCPLEQLPVAIAQARQVGAKLRLHAPGWGTKAFQAVLDVVNAVEGWECLPEPAPWPGRATSLHLAIVAKRLDITTDLIERGADVTACDASGYDALLLAAYLGNADLVAAVLEAGADPNRRDNEGLTPLMFAAQRKDGESVTILLRAGADPAIRNPQGWTALGIAKQYPGNPAARVLTEHGAPDSRATRVS
jgi:hypothetical protein